MFIRTKNGYVNSAQVVQIIEPRSKTGDWEIKTVDGNWHEASIDPCQTIVQLMPTDKWNEVTVYDNNGNGEIGAVPVVAFGLTIGGYVIPVIPDQLCDAYGNDVYVTMNGDSRVFSMCSTYADKMAMLDDKHIKRVQIVEVVE